ncbi:MAG: hypothetical protein ACR2MC_12410 [Actinomycetota bacterium]
MPHDGLVDALLQEASRVAAEIRASGEGAEGGPTVLKGASRRQTMAIGGIGSRSS